MARGMSSVKGPTKVSAPSGQGSQNGFVLGSRPAVLRAPSLSRITPKQGQRQYGKQADPFSTLGDGNTGQGGLS